MTRFLGFMVMKNEADRYLNKSLAWASEFLDDIFVYDDQSSDNSVDIASDYAEVEIRSDEVSSFMNHEGEFRFAAWKAFVDRMHPTEDDWILSFDADEFLISEVPLKLALELESDTYRNSVSLPFLEVFGLIGPNEFLVRMDGFWNDIKGSRFFRFQSNASWRKTKMACGAEPIYAQIDPKPAQYIKMLHLGYLKDIDKKLKYERYISEPGHNPQHVRSIMTQGEYSVLTWDGFNEN